MNAINYHTINRYFDLLDYTLTENNLLQHPSQIYNVDESGILLDPMSPNIVSKRCKESALSFSWKKRSDYNSCLWKCN